MRIVIATPLYPPEIGAPAPYAKELAARLAASVAVTVLAYAHLPESVPGVEIIAIDKRLPRLRRLIAFARALAHAAREADAVCAMNGASVELPFLLLPARARRVLCIADPRARGSKNLLYRLVSRAARARADAVISAVPPERPEILPLAPYPDAAFRTYEDAWRMHLAAMKDACAPTTP